MRILLTLLLASGAAWTEPQGHPGQGYDHSRSRTLGTWKPAIVEYSRRHYGEAE